MADRKWDAGHKAIRKAERHINLFRQGGGLLILILGLLIPATLLTSDPSSAVQPPQSDLRSSIAMASDLQDRVTRKIEESPEEELLKIQTILGKFKTGLSAERELRLARLIYEESLQYNYDPELVVALIINESSFYNWSKSNVGALGLMQILPTTGRDVARAQKIPWRGKKTLFDPHLNIKLGIHYLAELHDRFGDLETALTAYNYGPTRVAEMQRNCQRLPQNYTARVMGIYKRFLELNHTQVSQWWDPGELEVLLEPAPPESVKI